MAVLSHPHWEGMTPDMRRLLIDLGQRAFMQRFYLAGGTALALQIGHRRSVDLDFFSDTDEVGEGTRDEIIRALSFLSMEVIE